jgi:hypothetical protein
MDSLEYEKFNEDDFFASWIDNNLVRRCKKLNVDIPNEQIIDEVYLNKIVTIRDLTNPKV